MQIIFLKILNKYWNLQKFNYQHDIRNRTFIKCAKQDGIEKLAEYVLKNQENGIIYGWNKDYDNLDSEEAVLGILYNGFKNI